MKFFPCINKPSQTLFSHLKFQINSINTLICILFKKLNQSNSNIKLYIILFAFIANGFSCFSQSLFNNNYIIQKRFLSVEDGLPSREVLCSVKDKTGFMWFGTANGLCRYDGKSFKTFTKQKDGLYGNIIERLVVDDSNRLYIMFRPSFVDNKFIVSSHADKFQVFDLNTYKLITLSEALPNMPFQSKNIEIIDNANRGELYFISSAPYKIWQFNVKKGFRFRGDLNQWDHVKLLTNSFHNDFYHNSIFQNGYGAFSLIGSTHQYYISPDTLLTFNLENKNDVFVLLDKNNELLLQHRVQNQNDISRFYSRRFYEIEYTNTNEQLNVVSAYFNKKDVHCVSNRGVSDSSYIIHEINGSVYLYKDNQLVLLINKEEFNEIGDFAVWGYYLDLNENIWLSTSLGVFKIKLKKNLFHQINITGQPLGKIGAQVRGIFVDEDVMNKNELDNKKIYASFWYSFLYQSNLTQQSTNTNNDLLYAILKHNNKIFVGGTNLYTYDSKQNKLNFENAINALEIWSMVALNDTFILLGGTNQLYKYNVITHKSELINYQTNGYPQPRNVYRFLTTKKMGLTAVAENGLYVISSEGKIIEYYGHSARVKSHQMPDYSIWDMHEDKQGFCWLATNGDGLIRWNWNAKNPNELNNFLKFDLEQGMPSNILYRIEEDKQNNLWISSYYGLIRFNKNNFSSHAYTTNDGISNNEFNRSSSFTSASGNMYFGGMNGINSFTPSEINDAFKIVNFPFELTGIKKFSENKNSSVDCMRDFRIQKKITLNPGDKFLSFDFILLDYKDRNYNYAYKIEGLNNNWNLINEGNIQISGLPYGNYNLIIKAQLESGEWNDIEIKIPITVLVPFYFKKSFILLCVLIFLIAVFLLIRMRSFKLKKDNKRLESKVEERTQSLERVLDEKNMLLSEKNLLLTEIHHRVKNNLQVINGLLELRKETFRDKKYKAAFSEGQSSIISIAMIHELLYQNENFGSLRFTIIAKNITNSISQLFATQKRQIDFEFGNSDIALNVDTAVPLGLILNELLTNAYKYLPLNGENKVAIDLLDLENGHYQFIFQDNGPGLNADIDLNNVTSIGLSIVKRLVTQLEGKLHYEYNNGAKFVITFPNLTEIV